jgi:glycosyltransferase involved in cell wall biosynthesis
MVLPVSFALQKAIESYGIHARFQIIPNTVDTSVFYSSSHFRNRSNLKRILFVGLLVPVKGIPYLLKAVTQLRRQRDDWHLEIVGDGPKRLEYTNLAATLESLIRLPFRA